MKKTIELSTLLVNAKAAKLTLNHLIILTGIANCGTRSEGLFVAEVMAYANNVAHNLKHDFYSHSSVGSMCKLLVKRGIMSRVREGRAYLYRLTTKGEFLISDHRRLTLVFIGQNDFDYVESYALGA